MAALDIAGIHAPNARLGDILGGPDTFWRQALLAKAHWIKLLYPDHNRGDAERAKSYGMRVIVRAPGEGLVDPVSVGQILSEFRGVVDVIELGNEPPAEQWEEHMGRLETIAYQCLWQAHRDRVILCTPGHTGQAEPPNPPWGAQLLHWWNIYGRFPAIGVHAYGEHVLEGPQVRRVQRWFETWRKPIYITEIGIAARDLVTVPPDPRNYEISESIKATRYALFTKLLAQHRWCKAVIPFLASYGTPEWNTFTVPGEYDPNGVRSYWLSDRAWQKYGDTLALWEG